jgi:glycosyltransferase involved in cell wall biosynthesis
MYSPFYYGITARLLYRRPPILYTEHVHPDRPRWKRIVANKLLLERRDRVVCVGRSVGRALAQNEGIPLDRIMVVCNGIDLQAFANNQPGRHAARSGLGIGPAELVILQVARLAVCKDHATALRALKRVVTRCPDVRLVLAGEGPQYGVIREMVWRMHLTSHVRLLGLRKDIGRLLGAADVFLLTSRSEANPVALLEAMAAGVPVVATDVGGTSEIVENGETGLLALPGDDVRLAEHIIRLAEAPSLRQKMGHSGRERALGMFSDSRMHAGYAQLYDQMLHRESSPPSLCKALQETGLPGAPESYPGQKTHDRQK